MDIKIIQEVVMSAWGLLFGSGAGDAAFKGVIPMMLSFLGSNPILLLPLGFYIVFLGAKSVRKLITGY